MTMELTQKQFDALTEAERTALERFLKGSESPIAVSTSLKLFELFCNGSTCRSIQQLNPQFSMGQILHARVRDSWDEQRELYLQELYGGIRQKLVQIRAESADYLADVLKAVHVMDKVKIQRFLQTKDPRELEGVRMIPTSGKSYKELVEALQKVVGQETDASITPVTVNVNSSERGQVTVEVGKLPSSEAHQTIQQLLASKKKVS